MRIICAKNVPVTFLVVEVLGLYLVYLIIVEKGC